MRKQILVILMLCFILMGAMAHSFILQVSPYSVQFVKIQDKTYTSGYSFGLKAGYRHPVGNFTFGADFSYQSYKYEKHLKRYTVLSLKGRAAYMFNITDQISLDAGLGVGVDLRMTDSGTLPNFSLGADLNVGYQITDNIRITAGADFRLGVQDGAEYKSLDFEIIPMIGAVYTLPQRKKEVEDQNESVAINKEGIFEVKEGEI